MIKHKSENGQDIVELLKKEKSELQKRYRVRSIALFGSFHMHATNNSLEVM